jgi:hypothetical protein
MSLLSQAQRLNTANQLAQWNTECNNAMGIAKQSYTSIATQLEAMKVNPEYTQEDIDEVTSILTSLNKLAVQLTQ